MFRFVLVIIAARSGITLHQRLLTTVMRAPLSLFTGTDIGSITTRFSQDIGLIDRNLPLALVVSLANLFICIGKAILIASASWYIALSFPALLALFFCLQRAYLRTSRQLRLLDLEEKAPVYAQFLETLSGLSTIRAFGWTKPAIDENHELVDRSQRPFYLLLMVQQWLTLVLDLTTAALALLVVGLAVKLRDSVSVGLTGVSLVQLISFTETLKILIQFWTSLETSIGAVARIKQFSEETGEENLPGESQLPPMHWPTAGHIDVKNISASYGENAEVKALDDISMSINAGEKIGICGRTGRYAITSAMLLCRSSAQ
jgi:ATP-binding cassette, subfamily C (CFTR/MRP), member 1